MNLQRLFLLGNILLLGLIIWVGGSIVLTWASYRQMDNSGLSEPTKSPMPKNRDSSKGKRLEDYALITSKDVFQTTKGMARTAQGETAQEVAVTKLDLELKGTVVGDGKVSYAFIKDKGSRTEDIYYTDDYVMEAQIVKITKDRVILKVEGREEALFMTAESRALSEMGTTGKTSAEAVTQPRISPTAKTTSSPQPLAQPPRRIITPRRGGGLEKGP